MSAPFADAPLAVLWQIQETNGSAGFGTRFGGQDTSGREIAPAIAQVASQQQRMKDCNTQASGMTGNSRKQFMSSLSGATETKGPHCTNGKPCGNSCIAKDKVCHK
jgi:psiF repeat